MATTPESSLCEEVAKLKVSSKKVRFSEEIEYSKPLENYPKKGSRRTRNRVNKCNKCADVYYLSLDIFKAREMSVHPDSKESLDFYHSEFQSAQSLGENFEDVISSFSLEYGCRKHKFYLSKFYKEL